MATYSILINEELNSSLQRVADAAKVSVEDLIHDFIDIKLGEGIVELVIIQYKKGNLTAREAWKMSGLSYKDFQTQALLSSIPDSS
ncbi:MAG: hypothetical protein ACXAD7_20020 [Candidatus Kariarchaeaceae archaeon]